MQFRRYAGRFAAGLLLVSSMISPALAVTGTVASGDTTLRVRSEASTAGEVLTKLDNGVQVEVLSTVDSGWYQISYEEITGYVSGEYLTVDEAEAASLPQERAPVYVRITADSLNIRSAPGTDQEKVGKLSAGRIVETLEELEDGWYRIEEGYISAEFTEVVDPSELVQSSKGQEIVNYAMQFLGYPYVYGGSSPRGFDCSGFTSYIYKQFGYSLKRSASDQLDNGTSVSRSELQPGDLVMFKKGSSSRRASHVGIYIGNNQFIHSSTSRVGVIISGMDEAYYTSGFVGARRIV
ncbi:MAG: C40 family peptidase [Lawsonibacter sp.]|nr:C40 family peptidase [Lawsonibacter sp.]